MEKKRCINWIAIFAIIAIFALLVLVGQTSAGPNSNATLSLDLIPNGGAGNRIDNGVSSGNVSGQGTKIAVEVFAKDVTTPLIGVKIKFEFDASVLIFDKAENSAFTFVIPEATGTNFATTATVTLPSSGFIARAEFTTAVDVTDREFSIGIKSVTLAESVLLQDEITTRDVIRFNAALSPDFDGDGMVGVADFLQLAGVFGSSRGDGTYEAKYDLDSNGVIGIPDFLIFVNDFGKEVPTTGGGSGGSPDLIVESLSVSNSSPNAGQSFTLRATVRNRGNAQSAATTLRYYRSSNATISTNDTEVGIDSVSGLAASGTSTESISLNAPSSVGTYYYGVCVDNISGESDRENNCSAGVQVMVRIAGDDHSNNRSGATRLMWGFIDSIQVIQIDDLGWVEARRSGRIETSNDVDYFRVEVNEPGVLAVYTTGNLDTYGILEDNSGSVLESDDDDGTGSNFLIIRSVFRSVIRRSGNLGVYYIKVEGYASATGPYDINAFFQRDHSDTRSGATSLALGDTHLGQIEPIDVDYFKIEVRRSGVLSVGTEGSIDTYGILEDSSGSPLVANDDYSLASKNFGIVRSVGPGIYYIQVQCLRGGGLYQIFAFLE